MTTPSFPAVPAVRTPNGLVRADLNAANRTCGCGTPATTIVYIQRIRGRNGNRTSNTSRIPLCARHEAAHAAQQRRRHDAIAAAWNAADAAIRAARADVRAAMNRPAITFTVVTADAA